MTRQIATILTLAAILGTFPGIAQAADTVTPGEQARGELSSDLIAIDQIRQVENPLGGIDYYTDTGSYLGRSLRNGTLDISFFDPAGIKQGYSTKNSLGGWDYFDQFGKKLGQSRLTAAGGFEFFDNLGLSLGFNFESPIGYFNYFLKKNSYRRALLPGRTTLEEGFPSLVELLR